MKKHIPNFITCLNLFSGCIGSVFAFHGELKTAAYFIVLAAVFDFFDGTAARLLNVRSAIGKELDSLADMVSFGFLPGVIMFELLAQSNLTERGDALNSILPYLAFLIPVFSALRLAKFNIDTRQSVDFIGLNTPTNTLLIASLPYIKAQFPELLSNTVFLLAVTLICSLLLVSEIRLFSLKLGKGGWAANKYRYLFVLLSALALLLLHFAGVPLVLAFYILFSVLHFKSSPTVTAQKGD